MSAPIAGGQDRLETVPVRSNEAEKMFGPLAGGHDRLETVTMKSNECIGPKPRPRTPHRIMWLRLVSLTKASAMKSNEAGRASVTIPMKSNEAVEMSGPIAGGQNRLETVPMKSNEAVKMSGR